jgi:hypothetical protein
MRSAIWLTLLTFVSACERSPEWNGSLEALLQSENDRFDTVMQDPDKFRIQIIYTQIDRDSENRPHFTSFSYRLDPTEYFYPASTVKLSTAALALEKINRLDIPGLDRDTPMLTGTAADFQTSSVFDPTSASGLPSVAQYIRKILLVSDNDAFNRLYELIGQSPLNDALFRKGFLNTRIIHRLELVLGVTQNQATNPVTFEVGGAAVYEQPAEHSQRRYLGSEPTLLGVAEIVDGVRLERPKDFSAKNAHALQDLHDTVKILIFPDSVEPERRFDLRDDDYRFLYQYMSEYPGESDIDEYHDDTRYPAGYVKFLMYGGDAQAIPRNIRLFNKVGDAYGFLTDAAYIVDFENNVEFVLAATIYTNENQTFNDNEYEYDEIGLPFLKNLGEVIYEIELDRAREYEPDLSRFHFSARSN